ncbi:hypothetical protein [Cryobacterium sp. PH31-O1]|uniref:hypothetical protein n=1 Tax=Cryobacterium sp. PH31-O1 TaxID=3046306 RepID=UPI0024BA3ED4|nr:hypothetical protein [Cryobacterium sp. PH31-O1]MDJ0338451.1 hypothetical protein [Cryobacterium sp. PH31-O1]
MRVEPGLSGVTPNGAVLFEPPRVVVGEAGSGGQALHSIADRVDARPGAAAEAPAGGFEDASSDGSAPTGSAPEGSGSGGVGHPEVETEAGAGGGPQLQVDFQVPGTTKTIDYVAYHETLAASVHNADALEVMLGKWDGGGPESYVAKAEAGGYKYFSLGADWDPIMEAQGLTLSDMFDAYNVPFLDAAIREGKTFHFSHDPQVDKGSLAGEFRYLNGHGYEYDPVSMTASPLK